ncbi:hypothetical protein SLEP1_g35616 [Rubroshorea leprosula]|uniref:Exonuclease domain-containing protein n=1 Tax=Rubroshorea leprosula TaxID=152421 RepID=A0AAV5KNX5_9ROSI|nr:hypothetical protein SLEP1_g35616 [Rubroshorea leprosula]
MAFERNESIQKKFCDAPAGCLLNKAHPVCLEYKDESSSLLGGATMEYERSFSNAYFAPPNEAYRRPVIQPDYNLWSGFHPNIQKAQQNHFHGYQNQFYSVNPEFYFPIDNRFQYAHFRMSPQVYRSDFPFQEFQYFVVIDFEATCDRERIPHPQEIIEFPSVLVNSMTGQVEDFFQIYVRPTYNQLLSDFCKQLTGIQQTQVDKGVLLSEALLRHDRWLEEKGIKQTNFAIVTWSNWDCRVMLESECRFKRIRKPPYFNRWINLKVPFHEVYGGVKCNLKGAVEMAGLTWEGRAHCGLDDAKNTARLLAHLMHRGFRLSITNSLLRQSADHPLTMQQFLDRQSSSIQHPHKVRHQVMPLIQFHGLPAEFTKEQREYCYCGVKSCKQMIRKPGPKYGSYFFGCGNWTATRGALCPYFEWATP